jgi:ParB family chromosome partitioning protein
MAKRRSLLDSLASVEASAGALTQQADALSRTESIARIRTRLPLAEIKPRIAGDTRPLAAEHVASLADSIAAFGLIQPIVVDRRYRLLAGGHRRAALVELAERDAAGFASRFAEGIPVHVYDLDAEADPQTALAIEVSENEKRRDYTRSEALAMAERLRELGYTHRPEGGAPRRDEKMLIPALAVMIGKSEKTIRRYLQSTERAGDRRTDPADAPNQTPTEAANLDNVQVRKQVRLALSTLAAVQRLTSLTAEEREAVGRVLVLFERLAVADSRP